MPKVGGVFFVLGLVVALNGVLNVGRGRAILRLNSSEPALIRKAMGYRDAGTVTVIAGIVIVLGSLFLIAQRGF